jgi:hypothetical protein
MALASAAIFIAFLLGLLELEQVERLPGARLARFHFNMSSIVGSDRLGVAIVDISGSMVVRAAETKATSRLLA